MQLQECSVTDQLRIIPWDNAALDAKGFKARSRYVETYWLGVLGPSTTLLLRLLVDEIDAANGAAIEIDLRETAARLGIGTNGGRNNAFARAIGRLIYFGLAHQVDEHTLAICRSVPMLAQRHVMRLPHRLQLSHRRLVALRTHSQHAADA